MRYRGWRVNNRHSYRLFCIQCDEPVEYGFFSVEWQWVWENYVNHGYLICSVSLGTWGIANLHLSLVGAHILMMFVLKLRASESSPRVMEAEALKQGSNSDEQG